LEAPKKKLCFLFFSNKRAKEDQSPYFKMSRRSKRYGGQERTTTKIVQAEVDKNLIKCDSCGTALEVIKCKREGCERQIHRPCDACCQSCSTFRPEYSGTCTFFDPKGMKCDTKWPEFAVKPSCGYTREGPKSKGHCGYVEPVIIATGNGNVNIQNSGDNAVFNIGNTTNTTVEEKKTDVTVLVPGSAGAKNKEWIAEIAKRCHAEYHSDEAAVQTGAVAAVGRDAPLQQLFAGLLEFENRRQTSEFGDPTEIYVPVREPTLVCRSDQPDKCASFMEQILRERLGDFVKEKIIGVGFDGYNSLTTSTFPKVDPKHVLFPFPADHTLLSTLVGDDNECRATVHRQVEFKDWNTLLNDDRGYISLHLSKKECADLFGLTESDLKRRYQVQFLDISVISYDNCDSPVDFTAVVQTTIPEGGPRGRKGSRYWRNEGEGGIQGLTRFEGDAEPKSRGVTNILRKNKKTTCLLPIFNAPDLCLCYRIPLMQFAEVNSDEQVKRGLLVPSSKSGNYGPDDRQVEITMVNGATPNMVSYVAIREAMRGLPPASWSPASLQKPHAADTSPWNISKSLEWSERHTVASEDRQKMFWTVNGPAVEAAFREEMDLAQAETHLASFGEGLDICLYPVLPEKVKSMKALTGGGRMALTSLAKTATTSVTIQFNYIRCRPMTSC
jgi:hypothetical protein